MSQSAILSDLRAKAEAARAKEAEAAAKIEAEKAAALSALRAKTVEAEPEADPSTAALAALRALQPGENPHADTSAEDALNALRSAAPVAKAPEDNSAALDALRSAAPAAKAPEDNSAALDALRNAAPAAKAPEDNSAALDTLRSAAPVAKAPEDNSAALDALRNAAPAAKAPEDNSAALDTLRSAAPAAKAPEDNSAALDALRSAAPAAKAPEDNSAALDALRSAAPAAKAPEDNSAALDTLRSAAPVAKAPEDNSAALDALRSAIPTQADDEATLPPRPLEDALADLLADAAPMGEEAQEDLSALLGGQHSAETDPLADLLADAAPTVDDLEGEVEREGIGSLLGPQEDDALAALLADDEPEATDDLTASDAPLSGDMGMALDGLDDLLAEGIAEPVPEVDPLDALLADPGPAPETSEPLGAFLAEPAEESLEGLVPVDLTTPDDDPLDGLMAEAAPEPDPLADLGDLDDLLDGLTGDAADPMDAPPVVAEPAAEDTLELADLDDLLGAFDSPPDPAPQPAALQPATSESTDLLDDLDLLLAETAPPAPAAAATAEPDALSALDDLLGGDPAPATAAPHQSRSRGGRFGTLTAPTPSIDALDRPRFRMAIFGDFSGRAARGAMEVGEALARRRGIPLDVDTVEEVIEGFATTLVLPIGPDGKGISVKLGGLDDLHPDELVDNLDLFDALKGLRGRLANASTAASAVREMQGWGESFTIAAAPTHGRSAASSIPADKKLSDFQKLIGDTTGRLSQASPIDDLIGQIVGPHIVPGPNPEAEALKASVDEAMSSAMRLVLHHPEFQALEAQWRALDLLARRIETDVKLTITLFDVSAEEIAADLASVDDLSQSGLFRLLDAPLQEEGAIGFSAMFGMYAFEETPPHAELLARIGKIAAHVQAPFIASMAPGFMEVPLKERHALTAAAWDKLRETDAARYLGLATPRFLLRRPYGKKTEPIDAFAFEEFTQSEGLKGMLWANPVVLVAILMAQEWKDGDRKMSLGNVMSLDDIPFHFVTDQHGDQVALPCTERNLTEARAQLVLGRGYMPVVSIRGRDVVRLASFHALSGDLLAGPWSGPLKPRVAPTGSPLDVETTAKRVPDQPKVPQPDPAPTAEEEDDLDALLAGFGDLPIATDPDAIDADLAALLEGL
ncbi:type VI secretion system contractile sheath domain-containing protein [Pseudorhodobacter sp. E13]|uniref:type VI secretion system contractile sheath domain-containing protein n=1 Tax=Pseudorhodobacter sp. E13 TaxID=2487931 RepID=UPI003510F0DA